MNYFIDKMINKKISKWTLIILVSCSLMTISCKKKTPDFYTSIKIINRTQNVIDSIIISAEGEPYITKSSRMNINDTTPKFVYKNMSKEIEFIVYIKNNKYYGGSKMSSVIDISSGELAKTIFSGCFNIYLLDLDTIKKTISSPYNRDINCDL